MSVLRPRVGWVGTSAVARSLPLSLMLVFTLAGCGGRSGYAPTADARVAAPPQQMAAIAAAEPELEDDGLPAQRPPLMRANPTPDNPSEPFSPNYGKAPSKSTEAPAAVVRTPVTQTAAHRLPADLPPYFRARMALVQAGE